MPRLTGLRNSGDFLIEISLWRKVWGHVTLRLEISWRGVQREESLVSRKYSPCKGRRVNGRTLGGMNEVPWYSVGDLRQSPTQ